MKGLGQILTKDFSFLDFSVCVMHLPSLWEAEKTSQRNDSCTRTWKYELNRGVCVCVWLRWGRVYRILDLGNKGFMNLKVNSVCTG